MIQGQRARKALAVGFQVRLGMTVQELVDVSSCGDNLTEFTHLSDALDSPATLKGCDLIIACLDSDSLHDLHYMQQVRETCPKVTLIALFDVQQDLALAQATICTVLSDFLQSQSAPGNGVACPGASGTYHDSRPVQAVPVQHDYPLTARQREVLGLIGQGKSNKQIARDLDLSDGTVKLHCMAIFRALKVSNRTQAAILSHDLDLEPGPNMTQPSRHSGLAKAMN